MALSDAERQARRREKLKAKGKVLFQAWVTSAQSKQITALLDGAGVTYHTPPVPLRRKRRRSIDPVFWENRRIVAAYARPTQTANQDCLVPRATRVRSEEEKESAKIHTSS